MLTFFTSFFFLILSFIKLLLYDYKHYKPDEQLIETIVKHIISLDNSD